MESTAQRTNVSVSCIACRVARSRCDALAPCSGCARKQVECAYPSTSIKRGPKKGTKYKKRKVKGEEGDESSLSNVLDESPVAGPSRLPQKRNRSDPASQLSPTLPRDTSLAVVEPKIPSGFTIPTQIVLHLIDIFFTHVNTQTFPILSQATFEASLSRGEVGSALLYAICAASAGFSTHPAAQYLPPPELPRQSPAAPSRVEEARLANGVWVDRARHALAQEPGGEFTLEGVTALAIISMFELSRGNGRTAWRDLGSAMRGAQIGGFDDSTNQTETGHDWDMRQRAVWSLFCLEAILGCGCQSVSLLSGVASLAALESLPLPLSSKVDIVEADFVREVSPHPSDASFPILFLSGGRVLHSVDICGIEPFLCRSFDIFARVNRFLASTRHASHSARNRSSHASSQSQHFPPAPLSARLPDWNPASSFAKLSLDLSTWAMHLPIPFSFNPTVIATLPKVTQLSMFYTTHIVHHLAQVCLHRPYISDLRYHWQRRDAPQPPPTNGAIVFANSCHRKAVVHAISLARILVSGTKHASFALSPIAGFAAFTGATALLFNAEIHGTSAASQALQFFVSFLLTGAELFAPLKTYHSTLLRLIQIHSTFTAPSPSPDIFALPFSDFFTRYEQFGVSEPALAPLVSSSGPVEPPPNFSTTSKSPTEHPLPNDLQGHLSHLREVMEAVASMNSQPSGITNGHPLASLPGNHYSYDTTPSLPPSLPLVPSHSPASHRHPPLVHHDGFLPRPPLTSQSPHPTLSSSLFLLVESPSAPTPDASHLASTSSSTPNYFQSNGSPHLSGVHQMAQDGSGILASGSLSIPEFTDPSDIFTWLLNEPVTENIFEDQALEAMLGGCEWSLFQEDGLL